MYKIFLLLIILLLSLGMSSNPNKLSKYKNGQKIDVQGILRLVGSEPFTRLVVSDTNGIDFYLPKDKKKTETKFIGNIIRVHGDLYIIKLETPNHKYKHYEAHLSNVILISNK